MAEVEVLNPREVEQFHSTTQLLNCATVASRVRLRFGKADNFAAFFPLAAFLEQLDPLETL
jgi:hypothetical protein